MSILPAVLLGLLALLILVRVVWSIALKVRPIVADMPRRIAGWRTTLKEYGRLFTKPHRKSTVGLLGLIGAVAVLFNQFYGEADVIGWLLFGAIIFGIRKWWITDDYRRAEKAAADAERVREEARRERETRNMPPPAVTSLYTIFGLSESATDVDIRAAYRKLVKKYHPDRSKYSNAADAAMFRQVQEAYAELRARRGSWTN